MQFGKYFLRYAVFYKKTCTFVHENHNIVAMPGVAPGSMFSFAPATVGAFFFEKISFGEKIVLR